MSDTTTTTTSYTPPPIADGEIYIGLIGDHRGQAYHLILLPGENDPAPWAVQLEWARSIGGDLPNRVEQAMLWAWFREQFNRVIYWSGEQHNKKSGLAWFQHFYGGGQDDGYEFYEFRARAVRRVYVKEAA